MSKSNKGTTNDIAPVATVDDAAAAKFDMSPHIVQLMLNEPFYAAVLRGVNFTKTNDIPTAGVLAKDGDVHMWWNPNFVAALPPKHVLGLLMHEAMHLALMHTTTRRLEPHKIHNWAADLAINSNIPEDELPEGGLIPGKAFAPLTEEQLEKMKPEAVERFNRMSKFVEELPKGLSTEEYFARLMQDEQMKEDLEQQGEGGEGEPGEMDHHDGWDELSAEEKELAAGKIKQAVAEAAKECDQKGSWGSVPASMQAEIRKLLVNEIPWQKVLQKFVGFTKRSVRSTSWNKLNKKNLQMMLMKIINNLHIVDKSNLII